MAERRISPKARKARETSAADRLIREVATSIVSLIREGKTERDLGLARPWVPPQNIIYGNRYSGVNAISLTAQARARGQNDCRFLTLRSLGKLRDREGNTARLKEGAKPYLVMTPRRGQGRPLAPDEDPSAYPEKNLEVKEDGKLWLKGKLYFASVRVYSVADTTADVPPLRVQRSGVFLENSFLDKAIAACGARVVHDSPDGAYYSRREDTIHMPPRESYDSPALYYATLCHEFFHWTGAGSREGRVLGAGFGEDEYAREELRAELFAAFATVAFGLDGALAKCAGYIGAWNKCLRSNPGDILAMASQAQRVASALLDLAEGVKPKLSWLLDRDFSSVPTPLREAREKGLDLDDMWRRQMGLVEEGEERGVKAESCENMGNVRKVRKAGKSQKVFVEEGPCSAENEDEGFSPAP